MSEQLHTINQTCERLSLSKATVYRLMGAGRLKAVKIGSATRIPESALDQFISELSEVA